MKQKILLIGQAPPAVEQKIPYDTTLLYEWLEEIGISKEEAQDMFDFEAVWDQFPGHSWGGHKKPTYEQMENYWQRGLEEKVQVADKVWLLGKVASDFVMSRNKTWGCNVEILETMHPSKRNVFLYKRNKESLLREIKQFINK